MRTTEAHYKEVSVNQSTCVNVKAKEQTSSGADRDHGRTEAPAPVVLAAVAAMSDDDTGGRLCVERGGTGIRCLASRVALVGKIKRCSES
jgi:hypothetical protein